MFHLTKKIVLIVLAIASVSTFAQGPETASPGPIPKVSLPPVQYQYPSLVCGKPLPQLSEDTMTKLKTFYSECFTKSCNTNDPTDEFVYALSEVLFKEPREFIKKYADANQGYIVLCSLFGKESLGYVSCNYKMGANIDYQGDHCRNPELRIPTPIFGANKAAFSIEMQEMPAANAPSLKELYSDNQEFLATTDVHEFVFHGRGRFRGLIQGPKKVRMMQNLNCESLTASATETLEATDTPLPPTTDTFTIQQSPTDSLSVTTTETQEITSSPSATISSSATPTITSEMSPTATQGISPSTSNTPSDFVSSSKTIPEPIANWLASSGMYNDTTSQPGARYQINNGVVVDTLTGFEWEQAHSNTTYNWTYANNTYCQSQNAGSYTDWRLPTVLELQSLVDYTIPFQDPVAGINATAFPNTPKNYFWSSTLMTGGAPDQSWYVNYGKDSCDASQCFGTCVNPSCSCGSTCYTCYSGLVHSQYWQCCHSVQPTGYIRCIRSGITPPIIDRYDISVSGIVKDRLTNLEWERAATNSPKNWQQAKDYCSGLNLVGYKWRLPTVKELSTLLDHRVSPCSNKLAMDGIFTGDVYWYWSSTAVAGSGGARAWFVHFGYGYVYYYDVGHTYRVRCVRADGI